MKTKSRNKLFNVIALIAVLALATPWSAFADDLVVDGDGVTPVATSELNLGNVNVGSSKSGTVLLAIQRQSNGANVFKAGSPVTVSGSTADSRIQKPTLNDSSITPPAGWSELGFGTITSDTATSTVTLSAASAPCGVKSATIQYEAKGVNTDGKELTRSASLTVNWTVVNCEVSTSVSNITASNSTYGGTTDLSATVSPAGAIGTVNFYINGSNSAIAATYDKATGRATVNNHIHGLNASATPYSVKAVFASSDVGFKGNEATNPGALMVGKVTPTVNVTGGTYTYDGMQHAASGSVLGVGNANLGAPSFTYNGSTNAPRDAGTYGVVASFAGNDNYTAASNTATIEINRADQIIQWSNPAEITYGTRLSETQLNAVRTTGDGALSYNPAAGKQLNAGTHTLRVDAAATDNYNAAYAEREITVNKANPVITWNNPAAITYGTALSGAQLNATANVAGAFEYSVAANTVLNAGDHTLSVTFTPIDANNYNTATAQVTIVVNRADQVITWDDPAEITYGTRLSETQLNAVRTTGDGELSYSHNIGAMLDAGTYTLRVDAAATDNYNAASKTVTLTVNKATPTVEVTGGTYTYDRTAKVATGTVLGILNEALGTPSFIYNGSGNAPVNAGTYSVVGSFAGNKNYNSASSNPASIVINQRQLTVSATGVNKPYDGTTSATVTLATDAYSNDEVNAAYSGASFADKNVGMGKSVSVSGISISGRDAANYTLSNTTASTTANIISLGITGSFTAANKVYDGTTSATVTGRSLSGVITGDDVRLAGGTATFDTASVGTGKTVTLTGASLTGTDAGNYSLTSVATAKANISAWTLNGFYQPVDMSGTWNTVKNGSTVPFKFEVLAGTTELNSVSVVKTFTQATVACTNGNEDAIEETVPDTGGTSLRYDTTSGQFIQNWKTPSKPNTCYRVTMTTQDGSTLIALFKLK